MKGTVVQFGAGGIGRGFMGHLFTAAGFEVVFVDVIPAVVAALNARGAYPLRMAGPDRFETLTIAPVRAVDARDEGAVTRELAACAFACTAVGVPVLAHLAAPLAAGIRARARPLDVILCENQLRCSDLLRGLLAARLEEGEAARVGLVESVVSRMVPPVPEDERAADPLLVVAEDYARLPVDRKGFVGPVPDVPGLAPVEDFPAHVERKLFVHNMGHAAAAYLGYAAGHRFLHEAMEDAGIAAVVEAAMEEAGAALHRKHGLDPAGTRAHREDLLRRFRSPALGDTVLRVGRDPARKLRPEDRLVGAALACLDWGVEPAAIARGIAAAFRFRAEGDPSAAEIAAVLREHGPEEAVRRFTGQTPGGELGRRILAEMARSEEEHSRDE